MIFSLIIWLLITIVMFIVGVIELIFYLIIGIVVLGCVSLIMLPIELGIKMIKKLFN